MGEKRTTVEANKLSAADRKILIDAIKNKLVEFKGALAQTAYNDLWNEQAMDAGPFSPKGLTRRRGGLPPAESTTAPPGT